MIVELLIFFGLEGIVHSLNKNSGRYRGNEYGVYYDGNGSLRTVDNKKEVYKTYDDHTGDDIYKYVKGYKTYCNITIVDAWKNRQKAIEEGKKFYIRQYDNGARISLLHGKEFRGDRYYKITDVPNEFNTPYVKRRIKYRFDKNTTYEGEFYLDLYTKRLYWATEHTIEKDTEYYRKQIKEGGKATDYNELYKKIINEWYDSRAWEQAKYDAGECYLGKPNKSDYSYYEKKISRWR